MTPARRDVGDTSRFTASYGSRFVQLSDAFASIGYPTALINDMLVFHIVLETSGDIVT